MGIPGHMSFPVGGNLWPQVPYGGGYVQGSGYVQAWGWVLTSPRHVVQRDVVGKLEVRILLECFLVCTVLGAIVSCCCSFRFGNFQK